MTLHDAGHARSALVRTRNWLTISAVLSRSPVFHGEGYRKLWARLRVAGVRASPRRVRRVMGEHGLLAPHRAAQTRMKIHDGAIT